MDRSGRFSFRRFVQNLNPVIPNSKSDIDLSPEEADRLFSLQQGLPQPRFLVPESYTIAPICDNLPTAKKLQAALLKYGYVLAPSETGEAPALTVRTDLIDKHLPSRLGMISVHAQKKLISLLFFWEEECHRWRVLDAEENDIRKALKAAPDDGELALRLEAVQMKKVLPPSQRVADAARPGHGEPLPVYAQSTTT